MDDDKNTPLGPENQLDEHELDLNTPDDLEAVEDISFAEMEKPEDPLPMFDEFDDFSRLDQMLASEDMEQINDEKLSFGDEEAFDFTEKEEDIFASDAFDDVNDESVDFPEETTEKLGDSQLFDYDPSAVADETSLEAEDLYAQSAGAAVAGGAAAAITGSNSGSNSESPVKKLVKNRRLIRTALMIVLVGVVYGILRLFTGGEENPDMMASVPVSAPELSTPAEVPEVAQVAEVPEVVEVPEVPEVEEVVAVVEAPAPVVETEVVVPMAAAPAPVQTPALPQDQIANKLSNLEASLNAIDNRLSSISASTRPPVSQVGVGANMGSTNLGDNQQILRDALHKIEGIDAKMSYLSELQTQVHILSREVSALKSDVVQQSMIVGNSQAAINQSLAAAIDMRAPKMLVQAAIPGRAWLRSETGQLLTVIPGDEVAGYGRVVSIDPTTGTVVMSSRAVFREQ